MTVIKRREGMWPTPCASGDLHYRLGGNSQASKCLAVAVYPTPTAKDANGPWHTTHAPSLNVVVTTYPTPRALSLCVGSGAYQQIKGNPNLTDDEKRALIASAGRGAKYDTPTVHGDGGSGRKGTTPKYGQLNPDWEEWLMAWPVGWTDLETPNIRLVWLDPSIDPADYGEIPRITNRRDNRPARVKEIGNGQFPPTAAAAFHWGLCVLEVVA